MDQHEQSNGSRQHTGSGPSPAGGGQGRSGERMAGEYRPLGKPVGVVSAAEALLRVPGRVLFETRNGGSGRLAASLVALAAICYLAYGFTVGLFSGGGQLWAAPLKILGGVALSALICYPSLVVFTLLSGSDTSPGEIAVLLAGTIALAGLLLLGLGPVSWVFSQSTESVAFMGGLHLLFWGIALQCGLRFLGGATGFLHGGRGRHLMVWSVVFALVSLQMTTTLRPIVGTADRFLDSEKKFFLAHWAETLDAASRPAAAPGVRR